MSLELDVAMGVVLFELDGDAMGEFLLQIVHNHGGHITELYLTLELFVRHVEAVLYFFVFVRHLLVVSDAHHFLVVLFLDGPFFLFLLDELFHTVPVRRQDFVVLFYHPVHLLLLHPDCLYVLFLSLFVCVFPHPLLSCSIRSSL